MKILLIRLSSIGDIVLTTPIIRCIKKANQDVELHYLCKPQYVDLLNKNPFIDKIHCYNNQNSSEELKTENFDYIIDLQNNHRSNKLCRQLKKICKHLNKINFRKFLLVGFKIDIMPDKHIVDRYFDCTKILPFQVNNDGLGLDFFLEDCDCDEVNNINQPHFVTIAVGSQHYTKEIPINKLIAICQQISIPIVLLGDKYDSIKANEIIQNTNSLIYNYCGKLSIRQSAAFVKQSICLITGDTGLMHIGAALNTNIISIWGNTTPKFGMYPYMPNKKYNILENNSLSCRPCSKLGFKKCPRKHFKCMTNIDIQKIIQLLNETIN